MKVRVVSMTLHPDTTDEAVLREFDQKWGRATAAKWATLLVRDDLDFNARLNEAVRREVARSLTLLRGVAGSLGQPVLRELIAFNPAAWRPGPDGTEQARVPLTGTVNLQRPGGPVVEYADAQIWGIQRGDTVLPVMATATRSRTIEIDDSDRPTHGIVIAVRAGVHPQAEAAITGLTQRATHERERATSYLVVPSKATDNAFTSTVYNDVAPAIDLRLQETYREQLAIDFGTTRTPTLEVFGGRRFTWRPGSGRLHQSTRFAIGQLEDGTRKRWQFDYGDGDTAQRATMLFTMSAALTEIW